MNECALVILLGNEFQSEIECGTNEYKKLLVLRIWLNKTITIYICPSTMTYKNRRENKEVMYSFIHGSKFGIHPTII